MLSKHNLKSNIVSISLHLLFVAILVGVNSFHDVGCVCVVFCKFDVFAASTLRWNLNFENAQEHFLHFLRLIRRSMLGRLFFLLLVFLL